MRGSCAAKSWAAALSLSVASTGVPSTVIRMFMAVDLPGAVVGAGLVVVRSGVLGDEDVGRDEAWEGGGSSVQAVTASSSTAATAPRAARVGRAVGITGRPGIQSGRGSE
ncbi:hypothetical protein GCM10010307_01430 [Streptomyces vastus]|uniref:Secreted protein n=1 Tax=Streptomyces vastus TaxID=285451 RepID=A0ABP6CK47_9ACTN